MSGISGFSSKNLYYLAQVQMKSRAAAGGRQSMGDSAASLLDDGMYSHASATGVGASSVMLFGSSWASSTGTSGTMLDYFA